MARLSDWARTCAANTACVAWLPLLVLPFLWAIAGLWYHWNLFHGSALAKPWLLWAVGSAGYLLCLAGFGLFGDRQRPANLQTRITTALALGAALCFATYAWSEYSTAKGGAGPTGTAADPLSPVNAIAAVLAVVLAAVTLIAQKSASDARTEAEKARNDILDAMNIRLLASASRLLERAQAARSEAEEVLQQANETAELDPATGAYLNLAAACLGRVSKFLLAAHSQILDAGALDSEDLVGKASLLRLELRALAKATTSAGSSILDTERRLRSEFWRPSGLLILAMSASFSDLPRHASVAESDKMLAALRDVGKMLNEI